MGDIFQAIDYEYIIAVSVPKKSFNTPLQVGCLLNKYEKHRGRIVFRKMITFEALELKRDLHLKYVQMLFGLLHEN